MKKSLKIFYQFIVLIFLLEFLLGYYAFQLNNKKYGFYVPAVYKGFLVILRNIDSFRTNENSNIKIKLSNNDNNEKNYFIETFEKEVLKFHPFIDISGGRRISTTSTGSFNVDRDYFGFRNKLPLDFNKNNENFAIILTGGSECIGFFHKVSIPEILSDQLNKHFNTDIIKVYNLCMNSHTISNEIQNVVHIGYHVNPSLIISHTGWNDSKYFKFIPENFKKTGLIYNPSQTNWYDKLYDIQEKTPREVTFKESDKEIFENALEQNIVKFIKIANSFSAELLIGIQPYDETKKINKIDLTFLKAFEEKIESMKINKINFNNKKEDFHFIDSSHTAQSTAYKISNIYFEYIKNNFSDKIQKKISKN